MAPSEHSRPPFPVPNPTVSYWLTDPHKLANFRSHSRVPEHVDVAIIGSGLSGVSAAYYLLKSYPEAHRPRVAIFEARAACSGATGRNGGHSKVSPLTLKSLQEQWGDSLAVSIGRHARAQLTAMKTIVEREQLPCEFYLTRSYDLLFDAEQAADVRHWFNENRKTESPMGDILADVQYLEGPNLERVTGARRVKGALSSPAASLWPYKFVTSLLERVLALGGEFYAHCPVSEVSSADNSADDTSSILRFEDLASGAKSQVTRAANVIFATNGYTTALLPDYTDTITPVRGAASHLTTCRNDHQPPLYTAFLTHTYNLHYHPGFTDYLIPRPDGGIVIGGGREKYEEDRSEWWGNVDDSQLIEAVRPHFDGRMQAIYHGWEQSGSHLDILWTGIMGYTPDSMPHVGAVPDRKSQWIAAGFNGGGMAQILTSTEALVKLVRKEVTEWKELGLPALFEPCASRLRAKQDVDAT